MNRLDVEHFRARVVQDALAEALAMQWERRAAVFMAARPRAGDFNGNATAAELAARAARCTAVAEASHAAARLAPLPPYVVEEIIEALREAAA